MSPKIQTQEAANPQVRAAFRSDNFFDQEQSVCCFNLLPQPVKAAAQQCNWGEEVCVHTLHPGERTASDAGLCHASFLDWGIVFHCCFLSLFTSTLEGYYVDDALQGQGIYTYEDGVVLHGTYVDGELNGPAQEYDSDGRLIFKGQYKDNIRHGVCWIYYPVSLTSCSFTAEQYPYASLFFPWLKQISTKSQLSKG